MRKLFLVWISALFLISPFVLRADDSKAAPTYRPNYRYSGPSGGNITEEEATGKDPILATILAVVPGVLIHGFGNYYAEDYSFGNRMIAMEIFGSALALWGYNLVHRPDAWQQYFGGNDNAQQAGYWIKAGGVGFIVLSWIGDVATASDAALQYNHDHQLNFQLESHRDSPCLVMNYNF